MQSTVLAPLRDVRKEGRPWQCHDDEVVRLVDQILFDAVVGGMTDVHFEPSGERLLVRYRPAGSTLFTCFGLPMAASAAVLERLKIMASLDVTERIVPQDGRVKLRIGRRQYDLVASTMPCREGERLHLRVLSSHPRATGIEARGFDEATLRQWRQVMARLHGVVVVAGPTGAGQTTTLLSTLTELVRTREVTTVESPVEYLLDGATQIPTRPAEGLSMGFLLRRLARSDGGRPDVVMGKIEDGESAEAAFDLARRGTLVFVSMHVWDAPAVVGRLLDMGLSERAVADGLVAVLAQRLVRTLCPHCKEACRTTPAERAALGTSAPVLYRPRGCERCNEDRYMVGFGGRTAVTELMVIDDDLRRAVVARPRCHRDFRRLALQRGMVGMRRCAMAKAEQGLVGAAEAVMQTRADDDGFRARHGR